MLASFDTITAEILNLFQGSNSKNGTRVYPGDLQIKIEDSVSIQIHKLAIKGTDLKDVITIAVWIPERLSKSLIQIKAHG